MSSEVYDKHQSFEILGDSLKMLVPLNMNNQQILNRKRIIQLTNYRETNVINHKTGITKEVRYKIENLIDDFKIGKITVYLQNVYNTSSQKTLVSIVDRDNDSIIIASVYKPVTLIENNFYHITLTVPSSIIFKRYRYYEVEINIFGKKPGSTNFITNVHAELYNA